ncbi:MAG: hypothetical protein SFW67_28440 [Myxococcaceae bacterium]|nr:hypothetical protein [Myxococcaceae bacterium]
MRPFFSYYGAKWTVAKWLGPPRRDLVVEPFAGSACYATRWAAKRALLFDLSEDIVALWDWLIRCSTADVLRLPDRVESFDEVAALPLGPRLLLQFWVAKGRAEPSGALSPWYFQHRSSTDCRVWGSAVKARLVAQKPAIAGWEVRCGSYNEAPDLDAHWHVDPPYAGSPGRRYPKSDIDYAALAAWCMTRRGAVDVCENAGATWLPFRPIGTVVSLRGRRNGSRSEEAVWSVVNTAEPPTSEAT